MFPIARRMMLKLEVILLATGLIGALGQIVQIPNTPTKEVGGLAYAGLMTVDENEGRVYVSDRTNDFVRVFNEDGDLILVIRGFDDPGGMEISTTGVLYTADLNNHRVVMTTKDRFWLGIPSGLMAAETVSSMCPSMLQLDPMAYCMLWNGLTCEFKL